MLQLGGKARIGPLQGQAAEGLRLSSALPSLGTSIARHALLFAFLLDDTRRVLSTSEV